MMNSNQQEQNKTASNSSEHDVDNKEVTGLLMNLSRGIDTLASCNRIVKFLRLPNQRVQKINTKVTTLNKISTAMSSFCKPLQLGLSSSSIEHELKLAAFRIYTELAQCYFQIVAGNTEKITKDSAARMLCLSIESKGQALLLCSQLYRQSNPGYWIFCYQLYSKAEQLNLLDLEVSEGKTVNNAFKHVLLFFMSGTNQFSPPDQRKIYDLLQQISYQATIYTDYREHFSRGMFSFIMNRDLPPVQQWVRNDNITDDNRYISSVIIAKKLYQAMENKSVYQGNKELSRYSLLRVVRNLGVKEKRKFSRVNENRQCSGMVGLEHVIAYSCGNGNKTGKLPNLKNEYKLNGVWTVPDLNLVPVGMESEFQMHNKLNEEAKKNPQIKNFLDADAGNKGSEIWGADDKENTPNNEVVIGEFEIINSSVKGYGVLFEKNEFKTAIGEVIGLISGSRLEIGLIHGFQSGREEKNLVSVELFGSESISVYITRINHIEQGIRCMLIKGEPAMGKADSIMFDKHSQFHLGELIYLRYGSGKMTGQLNKVLHSTPFVTHVELSYPDTDKNSDDFFNGVSTCCNLPYF